MIEAKNDFTGGLDLDSNPFKVGKTSYIDAQNTTRDALEGSNDRVITNMIGNQLVSYTYPSGRGKVIGAYPFQLRNTVIIHRWNENGYSGIYEYNHTNRVITKIFESKTDSAGIDVLNYTENGKITSINTYARDEGDLQFWIDSLGRPSGIDITKFKAGEYTPVTRELLDFAKCPPLSPPSCVYGNDTSVHSNSLTNKLFRFKYRWIFDDLTKSTFSPISIVSLPVSILDDTFTNVITNNNYIQLIANTGGKNVKSIEIGMSYVNATNDWSDFQSVIVIAKNSIGLSETTSFTSVDTNTDVSTFFTGQGLLVGTLINVYFTQLPSTQKLVGTYTVVANDTVEDVASGLAASMISIGIATSPTASNGILDYSFDNTVYSFDRIDILNSYPDIDNINFPYSFYNDSTYPNILISESILLFSNVPLTVGAMEWANGNVPVFADITEGYDKNTIQNDVITIGTVAAGNGGAIGNLAAVANPIDFVTIFAYCPNSFNGIPAAGTVINLKIRQRSGGAVITGGTYTTIAGDTPNSIVAAFTVTASNAAVTKRSNSIITIALNDSTYEALPSSNDWTMMEIIPPTSPLASNSVATWPWSSQRNIARSYFDEKGRTNGVLYTDKITFPAYAENGSHIPLLPFINYKIYDVPPIWAYSFTFLFTKDATYYFFWQSFSVEKETQYIYFEVTSLGINASKNPTTAIVCSYTFQAGDRFRLIRRNSDQFVFSDAYDASVIGLVVEPIINSVTETGKSYIKIKNVEPFTSGMGSTAGYVFEIYRPAQQSANTDNLVFYENGRQYQILDSTLSTRRHQGQVADQVIGTTPAEYNFYEGDVYFRGRTIAETLTGYATFNVIDKNFVDFFISAVNSIDGRPNEIDINAKQQTFGATLRYGQAYQANTNINATNIFYPNDLMDVDYSFGNIIRIKIRDRYLKCFQQFKIGVIPLYAELTKDGSGTVSLIVTDKLLNPVQYRVGVFGLSQATSLASWHFADYGHDNNKAVIWRDSNDGVEPISELYRVDSWATIELPLRTGNVFTYGAIDPKKNEYISALEAYTQCISISIASFSLPDAISGVAYNYSVPITGTTPFNLSNETKPSWLLIAIDGTNLNFTGTPIDADEGSNIPANFTVSNGCGTLIENKTINVGSSTCVPVGIIGTPVLPSASNGVPYSYSFNLSGTSPFNLTNEMKPSWMTINVISSSIVFGGTPTDDEPSPVASFQINNCTSNFIEFGTTNWFLSYTNNISTVALTLYVGNNNSTPSNTLYSGTYDTDPLSGVSPSNLPANNMNVLLIVPGKSITSATANGVLPSATGGSTVSFSGVSGSPLIIDFVTA